MTAVEIRLPELSGGTAEEQLGRMRNYLFNLAQQLQFAFDQVSQPTGPVPGSNVQAAQGKTAESGVNVSAIKALIIKSAEITEHFQQQVEKQLSGRYVAQSQFGTFQQETQQRITANDQQLSQQFSNVQRLEASVEGLQSAVREVNASIRTGLLGEENGESIYGVEIGQESYEDGTIRFHRYARLTARKLSFYDSNDVEVAYVSDRRLFVTAASVREISADSLGVRRLSMGEYTWELGADGHLSIR